MNLKQLKDTGAYISNIEQRNVILMARCRKYELEILHLKSLVARLADKVDFEKMK